MRFRGASVILTPMGLDPAIHRFDKRTASFAMDARVKPAHDEAENNEGNHLLMVSSLGAPRSR
jgi:hypothetical protein